MHVATQCGHVDMVGLLLERGAGVNTQSKNGLACLHLAAQDDRTPIARLLTRYGANIDPQTKVRHSHIAMPSSVCISVCERDGTKTHAMTGSGSH